MRCQQENLRPGDVLFYKMQWWKPHHVLIAWSTNSDWVHVSMYIGAGLEVTSDVFGGVYLRRICDDKVDGVKRHPNSAVAEKASIAITGQVGYTYNVIGAVLLGAMAKFGLVGRRFNMPRAGTVFCSESVTDAFVDAGDDVVPDYENGETTPAAVWESNKLTEVK